MTLEELLGADLYSQVQAKIDEVNNKETDKLKHVRYADLSEGNYVMENEKYSVIFIFLLNLFEYALIKLNIVTWIFIKDATKFSMFLSGKITYSIFISTIFRSILYIIIVSCLGNYLVCNKDNFINEKK